MKIVLPLAITAMLALWVGTVATKAMTEAAAVLVATIETN